MVSWWLGETGEAAYHARVTLPARAVGGSVRLLGPHVHCDQGAGDVANSDHGSRRLVVRGQDVAERLSVYPAWRVAV
jgi:hypothetical protein